MKKIIAILLLNKFYILFGLLMYCGQIKGQFCCSDLIFVCYDKNGEKIVFSENKAFDVSAYFLKPNEYEKEHALYPRISKGRQGCNHMDLQGITRDYFLIIHYNTDTMQIDILNISGFVTSFYLIDSIPFQNGHFVIDINDEDIYINMNEPPINMCMPDAINITLKQWIGNKEDTE